jgi:hypothetical protein
VTRSVSSAGERAARRALADARVAYAAAVAACLEAAAAWRRERTGRALLAREDALGAALEARHWLREQRRRVAAIDSGEVRVEPFGGRLSPNALARRVARR